MAEERRGDWGIATFVGIYGAWLATCILSVPVLIGWHTALLHLYLLGGFYRYSTALFNNLVVIGLTGTWLALIVLMEGTFRRAAGRGALAALAGRTLIALVALWLLSLVFARL